MAIGGESIRRLLAVRSLTAAGVFLVGAVALAFPEGYLYGLSLLWLIGIFYLKKWSDIGRDGVIIIAAFAVYGAFNLIQAIKFNGIDSAVIKYFRYMIVCPVAIAVVYVRPSIVSWYAGMACGGFVAAIFAMWQVLYIGMERASGHLHPIQFGDIALLSGFMALAGALYVQERSYIWRYFFVAGGVAGIIASLLSGSRGGWIGIPFASWVLYKGFAPCLSVHVKKGVFAGVLALFLSALLIPQTGVAHRIGQAYSEVEAYVSTGSFGPSVGQRLLIWSETPELIDGHVFLGLGMEGFEAERDRRISSGEWPLNQPFKHMHNDFLDALVKHGLVAALLVIFILAVPIYIFRKDLSDSSHKIRSLAVGGFLISLLFIDFGLTESIIESRSGRFIFLGWMTVAYALCRVAKTERIDARF